MGKETLSTVKDQAKQDPPDQGGFGQPIISWPDENKVYPSRFGNGKNTTVATVTLPIASVGLKLIATIYGRLEEKPEGTSITYEPSFSKGVKGASADDMAYAKAYALDCAMVHPGWAQAEMLAEKALTTPAGAVKARTGDTKRALLPRLVKPVKVVKDGPQAAA